MNGYLEGHPVRYNDLRSSSITRNQNQSSIANQGIREFQQQPQYSQKHASESFSQLQIQPQPVQTPQKQQIWFTEPQQDFEQLRIGRRSFILANQSEKAPQDTQTQYARVVGTPTQAFPAKSNELNAMVGNVLSSLQVVRGHCKDS